MGILDPPRHVLNPYIFENETVRPEVKEWIFDHLSTFFPLTKLYNAVMQGSNVTLQYSDDSDIDVQIMSTKEEEFDKWHPLFKEFNRQEVLLPGTNHPLQFFFIEYIPPDKITRGWERSLGAYDLMTDRWLKRPTPYDKIKDPEVEYASEIAYVKMMMIMIESEIDSVRTAIRNKDYDKALTSLKTLQRFFKRIDEDSKDAYRWGAGTPNKEEDHVIFKLLSRGPYGKLLKDLV